MMSLIRLRAAAAQPLEPPCVGAVKGTTIGPAWPAGVSAAPVSVAVSGFVGQAVAAVAATPPTAAAIATATAANDALLRMWLLPFGSMTCGRLSLRPLA